MFCLFHVLKAHTKLYYSMTDKCKLELLQMIKDQEDNPLEYTPKGFSVVKRSVASSLSSVGPGEWICLDLSQSCLPEVRGSASKLYPQRCPGLRMTTRSPTQPLFPTWESNIWLFGRMVITKAPLQLDYRDQCEELIHVKALPAQHRFVTYAPLGGVT